MATLTAKITLTSANATSDALNVVVEKNLTTANPTTNVSRVSVATTGEFNILTTAGNTGTTYVYLKNIDTTNIIVIKDDAANGFLDLGPEEWAFIPVKGAKGLEATAITAACVLEYGYWTKG
jgi:hypothetical protein